jgi:hypothetical protein
MAVLTAAALILSSCTGVTEKVDTAAVQDILAKINRTPLGVTVAVEDDSIRIEPEDRHTFRVTLENPDLSFNQELYRSFGMEMPEFTIPVNLNMIQLLYAPSRNYLAIGSAGPLNMTFDPSKLDAEAFPGGEEAEELSRMTFSYEIKEMTGSFYDISPVLNYEDEGAVELLTDILQHNQEFSVQAKNLAMEVAGGKEGEPLSRFTWKTGAIESGFEAAPEYITAFFQPLEEKGIFDQYLHDDKPLFDMHFRMDDSRVAFTAGENPISVDIKLAGGSYYLRPEKDSQFNFGFAWEIEGAEASGDQIPAWASALNINRMDFRFNVSGIPPDLIEGYFEMMQYIREAAEKKSDDLQGQIAMKGLALVGKMTNAQPVITMQLVPLDLGAGKIQAEGEFKFIGMAPPVGKATVMIPDFEGMAEKLQQIPAIPKEKIDPMLAKIRTIFDVKETGEAMLVFEIREDEPGRFYLNGQPHKF